MKSEGEDITTTTRRALWARVLDLGSVDSRRVGRALVEYEDALRVTPNRRPKHVRTKAKAS